jgi:hypothetical protein
MRKILPFLLIAPAAVLLLLSWRRTSATQTSGEFADSRVTFQLLFGAHLERTGDYSGSVSLSAGRIVEIAPHHFFRGDALGDNNSWKLQIKAFDWQDQADLLIPLPSVERRGIVPAGVFVTVDAPSTAVATIATAQGKFEVPLAELQYGRKISYLGGEAVVQRTPTPNLISGKAGQPPPEEHDYPSLAVTRNGGVWIAWQGYKNGGDHVYVAHSTTTGWTEPYRLTEQKGDIFRTAIAEDQGGRIHVIWSERSGKDWHLYARTYAAGNWGARRKLTNNFSPNIFHRLISDSSGNLHLVWTGYQNGKSHVMWSKLSNEQWSAPKEISGESAWGPEAAGDSRGNLYVTWDSYRNGNYDIFLRQVNADGSLGTLQQVTKSPRFQAHPTVTVDKEDRVWLAWDESGANWGKDWTHEDSWRSTLLYEDRRPKVAVWESGAWKEPAGDVTATVPLRYSRYVELPRIVADRSGRIWMELQIRTATMNARTDIWAFGGHWEYFLASYEGDHWTSLTPIPKTVIRPEGPFHMEPWRDGVWMAWTTDNRPFVPPGFYAHPDRLHQIYAAHFGNSAPAAAPKLEDFREPSGSPPAVHPREKEDVSRIRDYRTTVDGETCRIVRGDFHRHTEISADGAGDGSLEDYFRYMIDVAEMDTGIVGDHNAGNNYEYSWWRTEKAIDLFHIQDRFTPLFGYERSVAYPNGHRNVVFPERGVHTLPISPEENKGQLNTGKVLYPYLKENDGIAMSHSMATSQGTDYRDNDPQLEPLVELYQGYHASYEYEGAPRAESKDYRVPIHGAYRPAGFWWNALKKGLKLGVQSSSDHISTHTSYALIYTPSTGREVVVESMRKRHAYAATDNIILDYRAQGGGGRLYFMGDAFETTAAPKLKVRVVGTARILSVEIIKNNRFVFHTEPEGETAEFEYVDNNPEKGESYYYVRAMQEDRNLAWSSPIWVTYKP